MRQTVDIVSVAALTLFAGCGSLLGGQDTAAPTQTDVSNDQQTDGPTPTPSPANS